MVNWSQDWPWIIGLGSGLAWLVLWEINGLLDNAKTHTFSRFVHNIFRSFPFSMAIAGAIIGGLMVHFGWPYCPELGIGR